MKLPFFNANLLVTIRLMNYLWRCKKQRKTYGRHFQISVRDRHHCYRLCKIGPGKKRKPVPATLPPCLCPMQKVLFRKIGTVYPMTDIAPKIHKPEVSVPRKKAAKKHKSAPKTYRLSKHRQYVSPTHRTSSQFEIHSAEEARKAIIWGENITTKVLMRLKIKLIPYTKK